MTTLSMSMFATRADYDAAYAVLQKKKLRNDTQIRNNRKEGGHLLSRGYVVEEAEVRGSGNERHVWFLGTQLASNQRGWWYSHKA